ncbi:MAG TPA: carboxypeptidase-like regulatory domain-containing protein, partial [Bryobacteraceae bacterium]|nr:carboxypeptidase-like regulatory domain-containing protein [Bryobacteraceae bacterium]
MNTAYRLLLLLGISIIALAQVDRGAISGTVTDPSGSVVAGVTVRITHDATNAVYNSATSNSGTYSFFNLPIGIYTLSAESAGFRRAEMKGVRVEVNQQTKADIALQVGEVTQTVEVAATASLIQTESTDVGTVIDDKRFL